MLDIKEVLQPSQYFRAGLCVNSQFSFSSDLFTFIDWFITLNYYAIKILKNGGTFFYYCFVLH